MLRNQNIYSNRHSPSKDIAASFANLQHLRFLCTSDPEHYRFESLSACIIGFLSCYLIARIELVQDLESCITFQKFKCF